MTDVPPAGHGPKPEGSVATPLRRHVESRESIEAQLVAAITSSRGAAVSDERFALILLAAVTTRAAATSTGSTRFERRRRVRSTSGS
jgi:hypothetical protein